MTDRSGRNDGGGEGVCSAIAGDCNRDGSGTVSRWTRNMFSGLFMITSFAFTTVGDSIHCTDVWGRGKVLQVLLFPCTVVGSQKMIVAKLVVKDNMSPVGYDFKMSYFPFCFETT